MRKLLVSALLSLTTLGAQTALRPPQMGFTATSDGSVRPLYGVAGSFVLGLPVAEKALSEAFSGSFGLLKTDSTLSAFDAQGRTLASIDAASGPALFGFSSDGASALAYVPGSNTVVEWSSGKFSTVPVRPEPGRILAIAMPNMFEASLIFQRDDGLWQIRLPFTHQRPASEQALPGVTAPVFAPASGGLIYREPQGIVLRTPQGSETHIAAQLPAGFSMQQIDSDWIALADSNSALRFAIRITPGREGFYQLPEAGQ